MYVVIVDILAVLLILGGIALAALRAPDPARQAEEGDDPRTYVRRIAGTMMAAFGLALGLMVTLFHFQSQG